MSTFFILMDAMRSDYISKNTTPFLWQCGRGGEYYQRVIPNFGFCERTEILTGQTPKESGFFTALGYNPDQSPFRKIDNIKYLSIMQSVVPNINIPILPKGGNLPNICRKLINRYIIKKVHISPQNIPLHLLPYWSLTEDAIDHRDPKAFQVPSILELLDSAGKKYFYDAFTALNLPFSGTDFDRLNMVLKHKKSDNAEFYLIYVSSPDYFGHEFGPESIEIVEANKELDSTLKGFTNDLMKFDPESNFIFLGDHGMAEVTKYIDLEKHILNVAKQNNFKIEKDFLYFLDSTLVRMWFFNDHCKQVFISFFKKSLELNDNGVLIDKLIAERENIPWGDKRYGDLLWWANTGVLIFPDFFHREKKYKGMHGYDVSLKENNGFCIVRGSKALNRMQKKIHLTEVYTLLRRILEI